MTDIEKNNNNVRQRNVEGEGKRKEKEKIDDKGLQMLLLKSYKLDEYKKIFIVLQKYVFVILLLTVLMELWFLFWFDVDNKLITERMVFGYLDLIFTGVAIISFLFFRKLVRLNLMLLLTSLFNIGFVIGNMLLIIFQSYFQLVKEK